MARIPAFLLLLMLPAVSFAGAVDVLIPAGTLSNALALVEANRISDAMKSLATFRPDMATLGPYHYIYGRAFASARNPHEAASRYRRASIYATNADLKELSLFLAAETELGMGYYYEAKTDCLIFLKKFPNSARARRVRAVLARSLFGTGRLSEALRQFDLAGNTSEALYGKADTFQKMGMTREASQAYAAAAAIDGRYPDSSEETRYWLGENLRLSGDAGHAKELLLTIKGEGLRDRAAIGLGEMAAAESHPDEALRRFVSVLGSKDKKVRRLALLRLADVEAAQGNAGEAAARLAEIVRMYPFTREYDDAVLRLARMKATAGDEIGAVSLLTKLVLRASPLRKNALDAIEAILLSARGKGRERFVAIWNAGGRWLMDTSRQASLATIAGELKGTGAPYLEIVRWLSQYGSGAVRVENLVALSRQCAETGDGTGVRNCLKSLKGMGASGDEVLRVEAALKFAQKDYRGAAETLLKLRNVEGKDAFLLGETIPYAGNPRKAAAALETAVSRSDAGPREMSRLADALFAAGRKDDAARYYRGAVAKDPTNEWACYRLALLLGKNGGEEFLKKIKTDPTLARMARAARREMTLDAH
ncbi:MAG: tetratricopeptide repeat protein [Desulfobacteria bacterium]|nr:tetratricopeptide repeat protein [Deltaproteobacteria bacterium]